MSGLRILLCAILLFGWQITFAQQRDSLKAFVKEIDSLSRKSVPPLTEKIKTGSTSDSLAKTVNNPLTKVDSKIDSLGHKLASLRDSAASKVNAAGERLTNKLQPPSLPTDTLQQKLDQKLQVPSSLPGSEKISDLTGELNIPDVPISTEKLNLPVTDAKVDDAAIPELKSITSPHAGDATEQLNNLADKVDVDLPETDELNKVNSKVQDVTSKTSDVKSKTQVAEQYQGELNKVKQGDLSSVDNAAKQAEDKATEVGGISDATEKAGKLTEQKEKLTKQQEEYLAMVQQYRDKKLEREEILRKAKNVANDKLNKFTPEITQAQEKLAEAKKAKSGLSSVKAFFKRPNSLKEKPFYERIVPGISLQAYKNKVYSVDFAPQVGLKLSGRFTIGVGGIYRVGLNEKFDFWAEGMGIYGYRYYGQINLLKGFYLHGEMEQLRLQKYTAPKFSIEQRAQKLQNFHVGLGKRYALSKKWHGNVLVLYRGELEGHMPSMNKINLRVGFDFNTKKRKKY